VQGLFYATNWKRQKLKEQDNIKELFSKGLENHSTPVRPEVWSGLQAKMAAAGVASGSAVAAKGLSALAKWLIGGTAASVVAVGTVMLIDTGDGPMKPKQEAIAQNSDVPALQSPAAATNDIPSGAATPSGNANGADENAGTGEQRTIAFSQPAAADRTNSGSQSVGASTVAGVPASHAVTPPNNGAGGDRIVPQNPEKQPTPAVQPKAAPNDPDPVQTVPSRSKITRLPNVVTPNNDGDNDFYQIESEHLTEDFSVVIMNDKGQIVFKSADPAFRWDGTTLQGEAAQEGNYVVMIVAKGEKGEYIKKRELFLLQR
jgi:gliding motility-associated-like protein